MNKAPTKGSTGTKGVESNGKPAWNEKAFHQEVFNTTTCVTSGVGSVTSRVTFIGAGWTVERGKQLVACWFKLNKVPSCKAGWLAEKLILQLAGELTTTTGGGVIGLVIMLGSTALGNFTTVYCGKLFKGAGEAASTCLNTPCGKQRDKSKTIARMILV